MVRYRHDLSGQVIDVKLRTLVLLLASSLVAVGLVLFVTPVRVQAGNPVLDQVRASEAADTYSCGSPLSYALGQRPSEGDETRIYYQQRFVTPADACPQQVRSNLLAALLWGGIGIVVSAVAVKRLDKPRSATARGGLSGTARST